MAGTGLLHLSYFPFAEVDDIVAHSHRIGLDLRVDFQVNRCVHGILNRDSGDGRAVAPHQHDVVRTKPICKVVAMRGRCHQQICIAELLANVPDRNLRPNPRRHVEERSKLDALRDGEGDDLVGMVMHHGDHIGTLAIDRTVNRALGVLSAPALVDWVAIEIIFNDVVESYQFRTARSRQEEPVGPLRMTHADVAVGIDHAFTCKNAVGDDEVSQDVGRTHCGAPCSVYLSIFGLPVIARSIATKQT